MALTLEAMVLTSTLTLTLTVTLTLTLTLITQPQAESTWDAIDIYAYDIYTYISSQAEST